jgi:hypothetical protein
MIRVMTAEQGDFCKKAENFLVLAVKYFCNWHMLCSALAITKVSVLAMWLTQILKVSRGAPREQGDYKGRF